MSAHHKHLRERERERERLLPSSAFYSKDYHSGDPHFTKRRIEEVNRGGSSKHYPPVSRSYSNDRLYEDKKHHHGHGHSTGPASYHQPYHPTSSSSSHHHRQSYEKHSSTSAAGGSHHHEYHHGGHSGSGSTSRYKPYESTVAHGHGHGSHSSPHAGGSSSTYPPAASRVIRKAVRVDYRKPSYEKISTSSASSGIRRIPPPLSPPPLMKITTSASSSSRYRQAPPEDRHHQRHVHKALEHSAVRSSSSSAKRIVKVPEKKPRRPLDIEIERPKATKRTSEVVQEIDKKPAKKIREEKRNGDVQETTQSTGDINGSKIDSKSNEERSDAANHKDTDDNKTEKSRRKDVDEDEREPRSKRPLLKLKCIYCDFRCVSFKDFSIHTRSFVHGKVMSKVIDQNRDKLISLKHSIRDQQKELEKSMDDQKTLSDTTSYCRVCEIDLRTDPKEHEANEIHNEIKGLVDRRCELCNVDFRLWKVYLFHTVALEHVKRVALKEMKERDGQQDSIPGSNMTKEDLGLNLLEQKNVIFCKACARYFPIREDNFDESCMKHCMALNHIKFVEDYTTRMKYLAKRDAEEKAKAEAKRLARKAKEAEKAEADANAEGTKTEDAITDSEKAMENEAEGIELKIEHTEDELDEELDTSKEDRKEKDIDMDGDVSQSQFNQVEDSQEEIDEEEEGPEEHEHEQEQQPEDEEPDEDEIQLHADEDDEVDAPREDE